MELADVATMSGSRQSSRGMLAASTFLSLREVPSLTNWDVARRRQCMRKRGRQRDCIYTSISGQRRNVQRQFLFAPSLLHPSLCGHVERRGNKRNKGRWGGGRTFLLFSPARYNVGQRQYRLTDCRHTPICIRDFFFFSSVGPIRRRRI